MILKITDKQIAVLIKKHGLPEGYRACLSAALQEAFALGHNSDVVHVKHKNQ